MGGKFVADGLYDKIVTERLIFGKPINTVAAEVGRSRKTITNTVSAFTAVKEKDWDRCIALTANCNAPIGLFNWAGERLGIEIPQSVKDAYELRRMRDRAAYYAGRTAESEADEPAAPAVEPVEEPTPEPKTEPEPKKEDNTALYLIKLLEAVNRQNELLEQLYDVVIPKWTGDMKDNVNVNADMLNQSLKRIDDKLEAIKINVRKRGL